jgi:hypothetical protein
LELIRSTLGGVGNIYQNGYGRDTILYRVSSVKDLRVIIDHFDKYPLITQRGPVFTQGCGALAQDLLIIFYSKKPMS